jgi:RNA polymerase subunit RPABC4/transcription elongation factor Spt4
MAETKVCEVCEQEIGKDEKTCPKCSTDFETLEDEVKVVTRAQKVLAARKAREEAERAPVPEPAPKKRSVFRSLGGR